MGDARAARHQKGPSREMVPPRRSVDDDLNFFPGLDLGHGKLDRVLTGLSGFALGSVACDGVVSYTGVKQIDRFIGQALTRGSHEP